MDGLLLLVHKGHIGPCVDLVFHNGWIQPGNFSVRPGKDVMKLLEERFVGSDFIRGAGCPQHDLFNNLRIGWDVSHVPSAGMGFLNQSSFPWMKSLVSMENWSDYGTRSLGRRNERWCMSSHGYSRAVRDSSISSLLLKQWRDKFDGPSLEVEISGSVELDIMLMDMVSEEGGGGWTSSIKVISDSRECWRRLSRAIQNLRKSWQWWE